MKYHLLGDVSGLALMFEISAQISAKDQNYNGQSLYYLAILHLGKIGRGENMRKCRG